MPSDILTTLSPTRHHGHSAVDCCPGNHHLPTPSGGTRHSPQLGEAVQGLPESQHLSAGHQGFLWAFQDLLQLHLGEHQAVGGRTAVRTPEGPPSPGLPPGVEPQGIVPHQSSPHQPTSPALRRQSAHKHGGRSRIPGSRALSLPRFPILSAEAQSAPLHLSASLWLLLIPILYHPAHLSSTVCRGGGLPPHPQLCSILLTEHMAIFLLTCSPGLISETDPEGN